MTPDSTQVTKETIYKDIKGALHDMGEALKVGAEHVYEVLVRQQIVNSIATVLVYAVLIALAIILVRHTMAGINRYNKTKQSYDDWPGELIASFIFSIILCCGLCGIFLATIQSVITGFVNPEYGAIKDILNVIK